MDEKYDVTGWEAETSLGRRLFLYNYGMRGSEFAGWELVKTVVTEHEPGVREKVYLWRRKKAEEELVQVSVVETSYWRQAQQYLKLHLEHCMRPEVPRAAAKAASVGDIQYASPAAETAGIATMFFTRGNLQVSVRSVGAKPVDVTKFARNLDGQFTKPPTKAEVKAGVATTLQPETVAVRKKGEAAAVLEQLPEPTARSGWLRVAVPEGELRREGDALYYTSDKAGRKNVEVINLKLE